MKNFLAVLFFFVVNVLNVSTVDAAQMVRISDVNLGQYLSTVRSAANSNEIRSVVKLEFSNPVRLEQNDRESMQLKCWTSTISADSKKVGAIFFSVDNQNLVSALEIFIADQENETRNVNLFSASLISIFAPLQLSESEFSAVISEIFSETDPVWCEKSQRYIVAQTTEEGILTVIAMIE